MSKRIRFMVRVKSSCSSLERASEQLSKLEGGGEKERGEKGKWEERERREGRRRKAKEGGEKRGKRKEGLLNYITIPKCEFLLDNVIVSPLLPFPSHPHGHYLTSFSLGEDLAMVTILSSSSFPNSPIPSTGIQST